jgi:FtsZ-binding cell division protein ZapB
MKKIFLFIFCFLIHSSDLFSQTWTNEELISANVGAEINYLTIEEKNTLVYLNLARMYPNKFADIELKKHYGDRYYNSSKLNSYENSLKATLLKMNPLHKLTFSSEMYSGAKCFSDESNQYGLVGHARKNCSKNFYGECCSYGYGDGLGIIIQLLIDDGVSNLGHRLICLGESYQSVGVSINSHPRYTNCCVLDFTYKEGIDYSNGTLPELENRNDVDIQENYQTASFEEEKKILQNQITELKSKNITLQTDIHSKETTISNLRYSVSQLENQNKDLNQKKTGLESNYFALESKVSNLENQIKTSNQTITVLQNDLSALRNKRTSVKKNKYNKDDFHKFTMKIGYFSFYPLMLNSTLISQWDKNYISPGVESFIGVNLGKSYRRNSLGFTFRAAQYSKGFSKVIDSLQTLPNQLFDIEFNTIFREWFLLGAGTTINKVWGDQNLIIDPSFSSGILLGPKQWKIQVIYHLVMSDYTKLNSQVFLGFSLRI